MSWVFLLMAIVIFSSSINGDKRVHVYLHCYILQNLFSAPLPLLIVSSFEYVLHLTIDVVGFEIAYNCIFHIYSPSFCQVCDLPEWAVFISSVIWAQNLYIMKICDCRTMHEQVCKLMKTCLPLLMYVYI